MNQIIPISISIYLFVSPDHWQQNNNMYISVQPGGWGMECGIADWCLQVPVVILAARFYAAYSNFCISGWTQQLLTAEVWLVIRRSLAKGQFCSSSVVQAFMRTHSSDTGQGQSKISPSGTSLDTVTAIWYRGTQDYGTKGEDVRWGGWSDHLLRIVTAVSVFQKEDPCCSYVWYVTDWLFTCLWVWAFIVHTVAAGLLCCICLEYSRR